MTRQVRTAYRNHRKRTWAAVLAIAGAVALTIAVLPASANNGGAGSGLGVLPNLVDLGGQPNDCTAVGSPGTEVRITNPVNNGVYDLPFGAKVKLSVYISGGTQFLDFAPAPGATGFYSVEDVIVKGGQKSIRYDYSGIPGTVTSDTRLHAPPKGNAYFTISHVTFCIGNAAPVVTTLGCGDSASTAGNPPAYTVELGSTADGNCSKQGDNAYILESFTNPDGTTTWKFVPYAPLPPGSGTAQIVEHLHGQFTQSASDATPQANLIYDDLVGAGFREMPYCDYDPRTGPASTTLLPNTVAADVLPAGTPAHTSCLIRAEQQVDGDNDLSSTITVDYWVYSTTDGVRSNPGG